MALFRCLLLAAALLAAALPPARALTREEALRDLRVLERALHDLHPGLHRHRTPAQLQDAFAQARAAVAEGASLPQFYLLTTRLAAAVRCGHTWTNPANQGEALRAEWSGRADKLPLRLRFVAGRALVTASQVEAVPVGAELLALDGRSPAAIQAALLPYLRADGDADAQRLAQLDDDANGGALRRLLPLLLPPEHGQWRLRLADAQGVREVQVAATASPPPLPEAGPWQLRIDADLAVMTLPTLAFWNAAFDGEAWLDQAFDRLAQARVHQLVIDLRALEGGDDALGLALLRHLIRQPVTLPGARRESAYERVPYDLARFLDTWDFGFFDRTGQVTKGPGRNWAMAPTPPRELQPVARPFAGRVAALIGPQNSSAGFLLARHLKLSGAAHLVGQATAGDRQGLNGGQLAWVRLPASGIAVDIPLVAHYTDGDPPAGGVPPDLAVVPDFEAVRAGRDLEMEAARRWLAGTPLAPAR